jgi:hypothetical protein
MDVNNSTVKLQRNSQGCPLPIPRGFSLQCSLVPTAAQHMESQRTPTLSACLGTCPVPVMLRRGRNLHRRRCHQPHGSFQRLITRFLRSHPSGDSVLVLRTKPRPVGNGLRRLVGRDPFATVFEAHSNSLTLRRAVRSAGPGEYAGLRSRIEHVCGHRRRSLQSEGWQLHVRTAKVNMIRPSRYASAGPTTASKRCPLPTKSHTPILAMVRAFNRQMMRRRQQQQHQHQGQQRGARRRVSPLLLASNVVLPQLARAQPSSGAIVSSQPRQVSRRPGPMPSGSSSMPPL